MALLVTYLVDDAARKIGDPNKQRVQNADWLLFYNQSGRELCEKANVLQYRATFDLGAQALYPYPDEMTQLARVEINETPSNADSWRFLKERFEDEFRAETDVLYPTATIPERYFADKVGFYLMPRPTATIVGGGRMTYYGLPDRLFDLVGANFQLPEFTQDYVIRRMVVYGKTARNRLTEASAELSQWYADIEGLQDKMEDRSDDRRSSMRPRRNPYSGMR